MSRAGWVRVLLLAGLGMGMGRRPAYADAPAFDPEVQAALAEQARSLTLRLDGAPSPYFVAYRLYDLQDVKIVAQWGSLVNSTDRSRHAVDVMVRVGDPSVDATNFQQRSWDRTELAFGDLPLDGGPAAVRQVLWRTTDRMFKEAVESYGQRLAAQRNRGVVDATPTFAPPVPVSVRLGREAAPDTPYLQAMARTLSAEFVEHPDVVTTWVDATAQGGRQVLLDTLGTQVEIPVATTLLRVVGAVHGPEGGLVGDSESWVVSRPVDLPAPATLVAATKEMMERLETWRQATPLREPYVGPVVFEGQAAVELFRQLLVVRLGGTPPTERPDSDSDPGLLPLTVGRQVLPAGWSVVDDPMALPNLPSSFPYDDEGVRAQAVRVVDGGRVRELLMSCTPSKSQSGSNGHGRSLTMRLARGMASQTTIAPPSVLRDEDLVQAAHRLTQASALPYHLVVRRLAAPYLTQELEGEDTRWLSVGRASTGGGITTPLELVRRYRDGREERVRDAAFSEVDLRTLRDIVAAGASTTRTVLMLPPETASYQESGDSGLAVTITAPSVLISEVTVLPHPVRGASPFHVPSPLAP